MRTPPNEPHYVVTSSDNGHTEYRHLLTDDQLRFSIKMALLNSTAFSGSPRRGRDMIRERVADDIVKHFQVSNVKAFGGVWENRPVPNPGGRKHLWKTDEEVEREGTAEEKFAP